MSSSSLLSDLAPTGTLRVGINYGNPILATGRTAQLRVLNLSEDAIT